MYQIDDIGSTYASLPPNLQTVEYECLAYAFDRQIKKFCDLAKKVTLWSDMDNADPKYYDYMAVSIKAPHYRSDYSDSEKLKLLKAAIVSNQFAGAKKTVENILAETFEDVQYHAWHEYGGEPYHFKLQINDRLELDINEKVDGILQKTKALRSVRDCIEANRRMDQTVSAGSVTVVTSYKADTIMDEGYTNGNA
jgi:P2-related tail formation protein